MKSKFFERMIAYLIDMIIVSIILSVVYAGLPKSEIDYDEEITALTSEYTEGGMTNNEYASRYSDLLYESHKDGMLKTGVSIVITIAYFVVFQYMNKGQTVGKILMKLRVVDKDTNNPPTIIKGFVRSFIVLGIASSGISLILINILGKQNYLVSFITLSGIESVFVLVSIIMIIAKGRGLHDLMANTKVIKEGRG